MQALIKEALADDWGKHAETIARNVARVIVAVYVAGWIVGCYIHKLNDWLSPRFAAFIAAAPMSQQQAPAVTRTMEAPQPAVRYACAAVPARTGIAPQTPMDRAIWSVKLGASQAEAARQHGVSRSTLRRRLSK
jgi:hypothetical protein